MRSYFDIWGPAGPAQWEYSIVKRSEDIRAGHRKTVPLDEMERELGLEGEPVDMSVLDDIE